MRAHLLTRVMEVCNHNHPFLSAMQHGSTVEVKYNSLRDLGHAIAELADMDGYHDSFNISIEGSGTIFVVEFS